MIGPRVRVVVQARVSSARLPGKVLLPLGGFPLAILCAMRAANTGRSVILAIPDGAEDDPLADAALNYDVEFCRGPLEDVMSRFMVAIEDLDDDDVVVRLTGDNPIPDGSFVDFAVQSLIERGSSYVGPEFGAGSFPHGLSAEAFRAGALRSVESTARSLSEREHVTTALRQKSPDRLQASVVGIPRAAGAASCSIDRGTEYVVLRNLFDSVDDPVAEPWRVLLDRLVAGVRRPAFQISERTILGVGAGEMSLGTAQLGMAYGIANRAGQPDHDTAVDIIATAQMCGVTYFDTARMYGDSERLLGETLGPSRGAGVAATIVTKLPPVPWGEGLVGPAIRAWVGEMVAKSAAELQRSTVDVLLLHRWDDRGRHDGSVWDALCEMRDDGIIGALGASVQNPDEAVEALRDENVHHVQLPVNVLDWRWRRPEFLRARTAREDVAVHARSSLLQGVLVMTPDRWPRVNGMSAQVVSEQLNALARELGRSCVADLAFAYVRSLSWVDTVVVGAEGADQVISNVTLFRRPSLTAREANRVANSFLNVPEIFLNPAQWPRKTS